MDNYPPMYVYYVALKQSIYVYSLLEVCRSPTCAVFSM